MLRPAAETQSLADQLDGHLARLDAAVAAGRAACVAAGVGAGAGAQHQAPGGESAADTSPVERLRLATVTARDAFAALAGSIAEHSGGLHAALAALDATDPRHLTQLRRLRRLVREHTDALSAADVACRRALEAAALATPSTVAVNAEGGWVAALVGARGDDVRDGVRSRADLAALPVAEAHRRVRTCPDLARACAATTDPRTVAELAAATAHASSPARVDAVRDAFARLAPDRAYALAVLYPGVVGPLDGAPVHLRVLANRTLLRVELERARRTDVELETRAIARRVVDESRWWRRARAAFTDAWLGRDAITSFVAVDSDRPLLMRTDLRIRIRLYASLLYDRVEAGGGRTRDRQVVLFDPVGRGRIAEVWGELGPATRRLAVFVPGTGTAVRGFHLPTDVAARVAGAAALTAPGVATVVEAWMGCDFPYAVGNQSVRARYARQAAVPLRDHVAALRGEIESARRVGPTGGAAPEVGVGRATRGRDRAPHGTHSGGDVDDLLVTVVGHSYGGVMVGAAELAGLACERVLHLASPGAGPGVRRADDYPTTDPLGRPRHPRRFEMTAPGDPIRLVQWISPGPGALGALALHAQRWTRLLGRALTRRVGAPHVSPAPAPAVSVARGGGLGIDPARLADVVHLEAGVWEETVGGHAAGARLHGPSAHAALTASGTTAFRHVVDVVTAPADRAWSDA